MPCENFKATVALVVRTRMRTMDRSRLLQEEDSPSMLSLWYLQNDPFKQIMMYAPSVEHNELLRVGGERG